MKRFLKGVLLTVLAAVMCLSLCSCDMIEEMRESRAYYTDESREAIVCGEYTYKKLTAPAGASFWGVETVVIADEEIPLLLSSFVGEHLFMTAQKTVITDEYANHYCREDVYDAYVTRLALSELSDYCIIAYDEALEGQVPRKLNDKTRALIEAVLAGTPRAYDEEEMDSYATLYRCDEQAEILGETLDLVKLLDGSFYLDVYTGEDDGYDYVSYPIPAEHNALFDNVYEAGW